MQGTTRLVSELTHMYEEPVKSFSFEQSALDDVWVELARIALDHATIAPPDDQDTSDVTIGPEQTPSDKALLAVCGDNATSKVLSEQNQQLRMKQPNDRAFDSDLKLAVCAPPRQLALRVTWAALPRRLCGVCPACDEALVLGAQVSHVEQKSIADANAAPNGLASASPAQAPQLVEQKKQSASDILKAMLKIPQVRSHCAFASLAMRVRHVPAQSKLSRFCAMRTLS